MTDNTARDIFISAVKNSASNGKTTQPFGDLYDAANGNALGFRARPVVGGHRVYLFQPAPYSRLLT